ncbi:hypothetical protein JW960_02575 [candidate division KSB1 bacterium]|nr:hypothetical protein [candidate division KSB1 bacterium]
MLRSAKVLIGSLIVSALVSQANAQYVFEQEMTSNGYMGMMAFTSTTTTYLSPEAKRDVTDMKFTGTFMKHFNSKEKKADIIRLDKGLFWNVNYDKKKYTEMTFDELKTLWEKGMTGQDMPEQQEKTDDESENDSEYEWEKPVVKVEEMEKGQTVNGFKCNHYIVKMIIAGKHKATGIRDTMTVVNDTWNSTVTSNAMKALNDFNQQLFEKLGVEKPEMGMAQMMASYKEYLADVTEEVKKLEGYPISSTVRMAMTTHVADANKPKEEQQAESDNVDLSNPVGGMMGRFAKKMAKKAAPQNEPTKDKEIFQYSHKLKTIKKMDTPASDFEIPAGFKMVDK